MAELPQFSVTITPFNDHIAVIPEEIETTTASGILLPDTATDKKTSIGKVVAVGKGELKDDDELNPSKHFSVGDRVIFGKYSGEDIELKTTDGKTVEVKFLSIDSVRAKVS